MNISMVCDEACASDPHKSISAREVISVHLQQIEGESRLNALVQMATDAVSAQAEEADRAVLVGTMGSPAPVPITVRMGGRQRASSRCWNSWPTSLVPPEGQRRGSTSGRRRCLGKTNVPGYRLLMKPITRSADERIILRSFPHPGRSGGGQAAIIAVGRSPWTSAATPEAASPSVSHFGIMALNRQPAVPMTGYFPLPSGETELRLLGL
jgi:hypothetical protein